MSQAQRHLTPETLALDTRRTGLAIAPKYNSGLLFTSVKCLDMCCEGDRMGVQRRKSESERSFAKRKVAVALTSEELRMRLFSQTLRGQSIVGSDSCGGDRRYLAYLVVYPAEYGNSGVMTFIIASGYDSVQS